MRRWLTTMAIPAGILGALLLLVAGAAGARPAAAGVQAAPRPADSGKAARVAAGGTFTDSGQALGNGQSNDVALADVDGDGDLDAFVANYTFVVTGHNRLWLNQGGSQEGVAGSYADSGQDLGANSSYALALGDLDGDGDPDAFGANAGANRVWLNQGGTQGGAPGHFADSGQALGAALTWGVTLGDVDGDGDPDAVAATGNLSGPNTIWLNQGGAQGGTAGTFADSGRALGSSRSSDVALGDLDADGDLDAFLAVSLGTSPANEVWLNQGGSQGGAEGTFADGGQRLGAANSNGVALADMDGDGDLDAFVANGGASSQDRVWLNQGGAQGGPAGTFAAGQALPARLTFAVALADLDGDGDADAFLSRYDLVGPGDQVWLNDGSATFADSGQRLGSLHGRGLALGDVDGDGDLDAFVANDGSSNGGEPNKVWLNGEGTAPPAGTADLALEFRPKGFGNLEIPVPPLAYASFRATVRNQGPDAAEAVRLEWRLAPSSILTTAQGSCTVEGCDLGRLAAGASTYVDVLDGPLEVDPTALHVGKLSVSAFVSAAEADPDPQNNFDGGYLDIYICENAGCVMEDIFCRLNLRLQGSAPASTGRGLDLRRWLQAAQFIPDLPLYYQVREEILAGPGGARYRALYDIHNLEILALLEADESLWDAALATLETWEPNLRALVAGDGDSVAITTAQVAQMDSFLSALADAAGPELAAAIEAERSRLGDPADYVGLTLAEARAAVVGQGAYLPFIR